MKKTPSLGHILRPSQSKGDELQAPSTTPKKEDINRRKCKKHRRKSLASSAVIRPSLPTPIPPPIPIPIEPRPPALFNRNINPLHLPLQARRATPARGATHPRRTPMSDRRRRPRRTPAVLLLPRVWRSWRRRTPHPPRR